MITTLLLLLPIIAYAAPDPITTHSIVDFANDVLQGLQHKDNPSEYFYEYDRKIVKAVNDLPLNDCDSAIDSFTNLRIMSLICKLGSFKIKKEPWESDFHHDASDTNEMAPVIAKLYAQCYSHRAISIRTRVLDKLANLWAGCKPNAFDYNAGVMAARLERLNQELSQKKSKKTVSEIMKACEDANAQLYVPGCPREKLLEFQGKFIDLLREASSLKIASKNEKLALRIGQLMDAVNSSVNSLNRLMNLFKTVDEFYREAEELDKYKWVVGGRKRN